jgi:hypothetical protein
MVGRIQFSGSQFTPIESSVLRSICETHSADRVLLEAQLAGAAVLSRRNSGAGFFTDFVVQKACCASVKGERLRTGPEARVNGLEHGMGFILWLEDGYANCLEGHSYDESTTEIAFERVGFEILRG